MVRKLAKDIFADALPATPTVAHKPVKSEVRESLKAIEDHAGFKASVVGGTVDAIALTFDPAFQNLSDGMEITWTSAGPNTITNPNVTVDSWGPAVIQRNGAATLNKGDTGPSGYVCRAKYNGAVWKLMNPFNAEGSMLVNGRTALKAFPASSGVAVYLAESGRSGLFVWRTGNYAAQVTADTQEGVYIASNDIASSSGAWVRQSDLKGYNIAWFGGVGSGDETTRFTAAKSLMAVTGERWLYLPEGTWNADTLADHGDMLFYGPGNLINVLSRSTAQQSAHAWSGGNLTPEVHLPLFSAKANPVVVIVGDSTSTAFANSLSDNDSLTGMVRKALIRANPDKTITFHNRAIGGTVWASFLLSANTGLTVGAQFTWYTNPAELWIDHVAALAPDLVIFNWGTNETWNMNGPAMRTVMTLVNAWTKPPDILICTNTTGTTVRGSDTNPYARDVEQRGRDGAAGYLRTWAQANGAGLLDFHRAEAIMSDGYDPTVFKSERVLQGGALTGLTGASISLTTFSQPIGRNQTLYEASADYECRHFFMELRLNSIAAGTWGDAPVDAATGWATGQVITAGNTRQWLGNPYTAATSATTGSTAPTHTSGTVSDGGVNWTYTAAVAPIFFRLSAQAAPTGYPTLTPVNGLLLWRDSGTGRIFWNIRDRRQSTGVDALYYSSAQDSGVAAPTSGDLLLRVMVDNGHLRVEIRPDATSLVVTTVIDTRIVRHGGLFKPACGYDGAAGSRPTSATLILDVGRDHSTEPVLTATELWGNTSDAATTSWPWGGNGFNHPSSRIQLVYKHVLDHADLAGRVIASRHIKGLTIDRAFTSYATNADIASTIPLDDTIPQNTEGTQILSVAITPKRVGNRLRIRFSGGAALATAGRYFIAALFQNGSANALSTGVVYSNGINWLTQLQLEHEMAVAALGAITFSIRVGTNDSSVARLNGTSSARYFGGSAAATLVVEEIQA